MTQLKTKDEFHQPKATYQ